MSSGRRSVGASFSPPWRQLLEDNLFHADLHPGNIVLLRQSRVALIDFGTIGTLEKDFIELYKRAMSAMASGDYVRATDLNLRLANQLPPLDIPKLRSDLIHAFRAWEARTHLPNLTYHEKSLASVGQVTGRIMYEYKVQLSWEFMKISRTWSTLDASLNFLLPNVNYIKLFRHYFEDSAERARKERSILRDLGAMYGKTADAVAEYNLLFAPALRQQALMFRATTSKVARVFAVIYRWLTVGTLGAAGVALYTYYEQHHSEVVDLEVEVIEEIAADVPLLEAHWWVLILIGLAVGAIIFNRLARILSEKDY